MSSQRWVECPTISDTILAEYYVNVVEIVEFGDRHSSLKFLNGGFVWECVLVYYLTQT